MGPIPLLDRFYEWLADHLPRGLVLYCFRRVFHDALHAECGEDYYFGLTCVEAGQKWENEKGEA